MKFILFACAALTLLGGCGGNQAPGDAANVTEMNAIAIDDAPGGASRSDEALVFCKPVERRVRVSDCEELTALDQSVYDGGAILNADSRMNRGRSYDVTLIVDRRPQEELAAIDAASNALADSADAAEPAAGNASGPADTPLPDASPSARPAQPAAAEPPTPKQKARNLDGKTEAFAPPVGRFMQAQLQGAGFKIEPEGPVSKEVPREGSATWTWQVTPQQEGKKRLTVTTVVEGVIDGRHYPLRNRDYPQDIKVEVLFFPDRIKDGMVQATDFLTTFKGMLVALTTVVIAGFGLWAALRNKGKKDSTPPAV